MKKQGITSKDIAKVCHVSQATVSYVINNTPGKRVSEAKRREILDAADKLNYFPNASARNIRRQGCTSIGLLPGNNYNNTGFGSTLRGIKRHLDSCGYTLTLLNDRFDQESEEVLRYYYSNIISGVILIAFDNQPVSTALLKKNRIPYVIISENGVVCQSMAPKRAFENVIFDCVRFCREHHLERLRYFTRSIDGRLPHNKYDLIVRALNEIYPECDFERIVCATTSNGPDSEILEPMAEYISSHSFDIALTPNQRFGLLMQSCILKESFSIPQDIKHICLASSPFFFNVYPQISSLHIPLFDMGFYAAELILALIHGAELQEKDFECSLIHGDSTRF